MSESPPEGIRDNPELVEAWYELGFDQPYLSPAEQRRHELRDAIALLDDAQKVAVGLVVVAAHRRDRAGTWRYQVNMGGWYLGGGFVERRVEQRVVTELVAMACELDVPRRVCELAAGIGKRGSHRSPLVVASRP